MLQKDADTKKFKAELSRMSEEMKATGSRLQSIELKGERFMDLNNELQAKLAEEMWVKERERGAVEACPAREKRMLALCLNLE